MKDYAIRKKRSACLFIHLPGIFFLLLQGLHVNGGDQRGSLLHELREFRVRVLYHSLVSWEILDQLGGERDGVALYGDGGRAPEFLAHLVSLQGGADRRRRLVGLLGRRGRGLAANSSDGRGRLGLRFRLGFGFRLRFLDDLGLFRRCGNAAVGQLAVDLVIDVLELLIGGLAYLGLQVFENAHLAATSGGLSGTGRDLGG